MPAQSGAPSQTAPTYEAEREIRLAVVIYGGISLAIYINGIIQEMLRWVRATAPTARDSNALLLAEPRGSEKVYRKLGQLLGDPERGPVEVAGDLAAGTPCPVRTRFVIDILSGTSAGGINAVFLAKALAQNEDVSALERVWVTEGNIARLINDRSSLTDRLSLQDPPQSLLNGERMYLQLLDALDAMDEETPNARTSLVETLDLYCTATDLRGLPLPLPLADKVVLERRHRNVFHFRHPSLDNPASSDFQSDVNPFLAFAARCTSAFPFAFEPMVLGDIFPIVQTSPVHGTKTYADPNTTAWERFYRDYTRRGGAPGAEIDFGKRAFGDGGYLDNKPFTYAIATTLTRAADLPITRKLIYVEPDPEHFRADPSTRPDALENSYDALIALPRYETIRQDLQTVVNRNQEIERLNRVLGSIEKFLEIAAPKSGRDPKEWLEQSLDQSVKEYGTGYAAYQRLKLSAITDDLSAIVAEAFAIATDGGYAKAIRILAGVWRDTQYLDEPSLRRFALDFDVSYRLRRLRHVGLYITSLYDTCGDLTPPLAPALRPAYRAELRRIKAVVGEQYRRFQALRTRPWNADQLLGGAPDFSKLGSDGKIRLSKLTLVMTPPEVAAAWPGLSEHEHALAETEQGMVARAHYVLSDDDGKRTLVAIAASLQRAFRFEFDAAREALSKVFELHSPNSENTDPVFEARCQVRTRYEAFERYDSVLFPITFGVEVGEGEVVDIHRISPDDTKARAAERNGAKLKGRALGAFGAFFDETWRRNDILWGRLDGAERLIGILLPGSDLPTTKLREAMIDEAHQEIVLEFLGPAPDWKAALKHFLAKEVRQEAEPLLAARSAARSTAVVGQMLEDVAARRNVRTTAFSRLALAARIAWGFIEVSVPRSFPELLFGYWLQVALLVATVGLVLSGILHDPDLAKVSLPAVAILLLFYPARAAMRWYLNGRRPLSAYRAVVLIFVATALLAFVLARAARYFPMIEGRPQALGAFVSTSLSALVSAAKAGGWLGPLFEAAAVVALVAFMIARVRGSQLRVTDANGKRLAAEGLALTAEDVKRYASEQSGAASARLRAAVHADLLLNAACGLLFSSAGGVFVAAGEPLGWFLLGLGVLSAVAGIRGDKALLALLVSATPAPPHAPRRYLLARRWLMYLSIGVGLGLLAFRLHV